VLLECAGVAGCAAVGLPPCSRLNSFRLARDLDNLHGMHPSEIDRDSSETK